MDVCADTTYDDPIDYVISDKSIAGVPAEKT
jgi:hypothetical protein